MPPRIKTLNDVRGADGDDSHGEDDDGDKQNEFYAGGHASGISVRGPPTKKPAPGGGRDRVDSLMDRVQREQGARPFDESSSGGAKKPAFAGAGMRLGGEGVASEPVRPNGGGGGADADADADDAAPGGPVPDPPESRPDRTVTFFADGFQVGQDGPLRAYDDPANARFFAALDRGLVPDELRAASSNGRLTIHLMDMKTVRFADRPKPKFRPFRGGGLAFGAAGAAGPAAAASSSLSAAPPPPPPSSSSSSSSSLEYVASEPGTTMQIRKADGTRLTLKINLSRTVGDVYAFVRSSGGPAAFTLAAGFPPAPLTDLAATVAAAGLAGAVVTQRLA